MKLQMAPTDKLAALRVEILRSGSIRPQDVTEIQLGTFSVRYFGNWENPPESRDEEDFDWQVPTIGTRHILDGIAKKFDCLWQDEGEKNWIAFYLKTSPRD